VKVEAIEKMREDAVTGARQITTRQTHRPRQTYDSPALSASNGLKKISIANPAGKILFFLSLLA
jgi:hypothetical protein